MTAPVIVPAEVDNWMPATVPSAPAEVLVRAMEATYSPSDRIAYALDARLLAHPGCCSTDADYPGWVPGQHAAVAS